jgi:hypothetical protein
MMHVFPLLTLNLILEYLNLQYLRRWRIKMNEVNLIYRKKVWAVWVNDIYYMYFLWERFNYRDLVYEKVVEEHNFSNLLGYSKYIRSDYQRPIQVLSKYYFFSSPDLNPRFNFIRV